MLKSTVQVVISDRTSVIEPFPQDAN